MKGEKEQLIMFANEPPNIIINKTYRNSCKSVKIYPRADIQTDYVYLPVGEFKIRCKKL